MFIMENGELRGLILVTSIDIMVDGIWWFMVVDDLMMTMHES